MSRFIATIILSFCFLGASFAQEFSRTYEDFGLWNNVSLSHKWSKKWSSNFDASLRLNENASELRSLFTEVSVERDLKKKWDVGAILRYTYKTNSESLRFSPYVKKYYRIKPFNIKYRFKTDINYGLTSNKQIPFDEVLRNKLTLEYKRKKHDLGAYIATEIFHAIDKDFTLPSNIRFKTGLTYKINKKIDVDINYIIQEELHKSKPVRDYIVSWGLSVEI